MKFLQDRQAGPTSDIIMQFKPEEKLAQSLAIGDFSYQKSCNLYAPLPLPGF